MAFDPDAYLQEKEAAPTGEGGFDPDLYLAERGNTPTPKKTGVFETILPGTVRAAKKPNPLFALSPGAAVAVAALGDVASLEQRVFGKLTGQSEIGDPEGGYLKGLRGEMDEATKARVDGVLKSKRIPKFLKKYAVLALEGENFGADVVANFFESPLTSVASVGLAPVAKAAEASPALKRALLRFGSLDHAEEAVARAATPKGQQELAAAAAKENPDVLAREVKGAVEDVREGAQADLDKAILGAVPGKKEPFARGESLYDALKEGKSAAGAKFGKEQNRVLNESGVAQGQIPTRPVGGVQSSPSSILDAQGRPISRPQVRMQNAAQDQVDDVLKEISYDPKKGEYGTIGNRAIGEKAIKLLKRLHTDFASAKTTEDVLTMRRLLDNEMNFGGEGGRRLFVKGSDDDFVMGALRNKLNKVVEDQFGRTIKDPAVAASLSEAWRARNAFYSDVIGTMEDVSKSLPDQKQNYISALEKMDVGKLKKVMQAAQEHPKELGHVAEEIRGGVVDGFLNRAMKDGRIDFKAAKKSWEGIDPELRRAMFSTKQQAQIDFALKKFATEDAKGVAGKKLGSYLSDNEKTVSDKLNNTAQNDKRYVLRELEFLDALQGRTGKESFAYRAKTMSQARQLGMNEKGKLPLVTAEKTGKFLAGLTGGGSAGGGVGYAVAGLPGAVIGQAAGSTAGVISQSPWGIVQLYRALNQLEKISKGAQAPAKAARNISAGKAAVSATRDKED